MTWSQNVNKVVKNSVRHAISNEEKSDSCGWAYSYMKVARATPEQLEMGLLGGFAPGAIIAINREGHASNNCSVAQLDEGH